MPSRIYDVVVLYYRAGAEVLQRTLDALAGQEVAPRVTLVVDNASEDSVVAALDVSRAVRTLLLDENRGYAGGMNAGQRALPPGAPYVLFLTHEAELRPGAVVALLEAATTTDSAVIGPRLLRRRDLSTWSAGGEVLPSGGVRHRQDTSASVVDVDWLDGAALLVKIAALNGAPPFDERFFLYWEDVELGLRLASSGRIVCTTDAEVVQETALTPPYFAARNRLLLWRIRRDRIRVVISAASEIRRSALELIRCRPADAAGRMIGLFDGLLGTLHRRVGALRTAEALHQGPAAAHGPRRGRVVAFSLALPFEGIPHAGGEYALQHLRTLVDAGWEVMVIAPALPTNVAAMSELDPRVGALLIPVGVVDQRLGVGGRLRKARLARGYRARVLRSPDVRRLVVEADRLEFQWTESAALARPLARLAPGTPSIAVAHDVLTQSLRRFAAVSAPPHLKLLRSLRLRLVVGDEARVLNTVDSVITFSEKDEDYLRDLGVVSRIDVIPPSLQSAVMRRSAARHPTVDRVLMVAAFTRKENVDGLLWLLAEVWPRVKEQRPDAQLRVVGASPTPQIIRRAGQAEGVSVVGYVADLSSEYEVASVAVVPLLVGAGVKFKTVTAMLWGVPVVSTTVGAEGLADTADRSEALLAAVSDDPQRFAEAIVRVLAGADTSAVGAKRHAEERFGADAFRRRISEVYDRGTKPSKS